MIRAICSSPWFLVFSFANNMFCLLVSTFVWLFYQILLFTFFLLSVYPSDTMKSNISHMSMSATLMIVLDSEFCTISHHMMITGTLMRCKRDVCSVRRI